MVDTRRLVAEAKGLAEAGRGQLSTEQAAIRLSSYESVILFGILGSVAGGLGGVMLPFAGVAALATGSAGALAGAAVSILAYRGVGQWRLERAVKKVDTALAVLKRELEWASRAQNTPPDKLKRLWNDYYDLLHAFHRLSIGDLKDQTSLVDGAVNR